MGGMDAAGGTTEGDDTRREVAARAEADHWRELAIEREAAMRALSHRPLVRVAVGVDRRFLPTARRLRAGMDRVQVSCRGINVAAAGLRSRLAWRTRAAALSGQAARLDPAPGTQSVSVIGFAVDGDASWLSDAGLEPQLVLVGGDPAHLEARDHVRVLAQGCSSRAALALGAAAATSDLVCFVLAPPEGLAPGWLARLGASVAGDVVAATPTLVHPARRGWRITEHDQLVRSEGLDLALDATGALVATARAAGAAVDVGRPHQNVSAAPLHCLVVSRAAYLTVGGLTGSDDLGVAAVDLCARLRQHGGRVVHVPESVVFDRRPVGARSELHQPIDPKGSAWHEFVDQHGPTAGRKPGGGRPRPRWVITTAVPSARLAPRWGDWHLAEGLAGALRRLGQDVVVQTHDQADSLPSRSSDLQLVVHGLAPVRRTQGQRHVVWVVSHPESFDLSEAEAADLVLVASAPFAADLAARSSTPVEVLLQATDAQRFRPCPPVMEHQHPVTVVAKTRNVLRHVVADALEAGIRPAIYGSGWGNLVDPSLIVSDHIENNDLPAVYCSAGVVLNDHWDTMGAWGFVSNRIFDVLACGAPIISDEVPGIQELFGATVPTYRTSAELGALVRIALEDPVAARALAARGREVVLAQHTFDHRARQLLDLLERHGLSDGTGETSD